MVQRRGKRIKNRKARDRKRVQKEGEETGGSREIFFLLGPSCIFVYILYKNNKNISNKFYFFDILTNTNFIR